MLKLNDISFLEQKDYVRVSVYSQFYVDIYKKDLKESLGEYIIKNNKLTLLKDSDNTEKKFLRFFSQYKRNLIYKLNNNKAIYIDEDSRLPLIGLNFIGIVDKGSDMLEVKPITNCNANCSFCSVDEGRSSKKVIDFVIDCDYLSDEVKSLLHFKAVNGISIWINPHGEPTLYSKLPELVEKLINDAYVKDISIITNGLLFTKELVDKLVKLKEHSNKEIKIAFSISTLDNNSKELMGDNYDCNIILKNLKYASEKLFVSITPVLLSWMNEDQVEEIIRLSQKLTEQGNSIKVQIQKFCANKRGRNPIKEESWDDFSKRLSKLQEKTGYNLIEDLGNIKQTPELPKICDKGDIIKVKVLFPGRYKNEKIGLYETPNGSRSVLILGCNIEQGSVKASVIVDKYNMITAKCK
jgi:uncharacterized protein